MVKVGVHVSIKDSIDQAVDRAKERGCDTFQMFTRNPRGWKASKLVAQEIGEFKRKLNEAEIGPPVSHMPYLPNLSSPLKSLFNRSLAALETELKRCEALGVPYVVTHLGSHMGAGREVGLERLTTAINMALDESAGQTILLLENTAGQKNSMGSRFEDIRGILDRVRSKTRIGVCFDTCHAYAAGYDLRTPKAVEETLAKFDSVVGFELLKVVHLNDSKGSVGSGLDRHEHIGKGYIGNKGFHAFLHHDKIRELPLILETPIEEEGDELIDMKRIRALAA